MKTIASVVCWASLGLCLACGGESDGGGDACAPIQPCGGDVLGRWQLESLCVDEDALAAQAVEDFPAACSGAVKGVEASADDVTLQFAASGASAVTGGVAVQIDYLLSKPCLDAIAGTSVPISSFSCSLVGSSAESELQASDPDASVTCSVSNDSCACDARFIGELGGGDSSTYSTQGTRLTLDGEAQDYCVAGDTLTVKAAQGTYRARRLR